MLEVSANFAFEHQANQVIPSFVGPNQEGNERFAVGAVTASKTSGDMRKALVKYNQAPHSAILGCADSRVPVDTVFDAMPGELFVLRNAGNTCTHAEGSMVGSLEFCTGKLGTRLILVLGHTQCGAIAGATQTFQSGSSKAPGERRVLRPKALIQSMYAELVPKVIRQT